MTRRGDSLVARLGVTGVFRDYGYRRSRTHSRLKFLLADWGVERFREVLEKEYLSEPLPDGPAPAPPSQDQRDHVGVTPLRDGRCAVGFAPRAGRIPGTLQSKVADLAEEYGGGRSRTTAQQKLVMLDVPGAQVERLIRALAALDLCGRCERLRAWCMAVPATRRRSPI